MPGTTLNEKGEILVTTADLSVLESSGATDTELLYLILLEARKTNLLLAELASSDLPSDKDVT